MGLFSLPQIDSDLTAWFILDGKEYEMNQFNITFGQAVDHKGQPQDETRGGQMQVVLSEALPESVYRWAMSSVSKNGRIEFRSKTANCQLRIEFINAYCVNFQRQISNHSGLYSLLNITPDEILINGISFDNHWV